jgi:hypothetical protein
MEFNRYSRQLFEPIRPTVFRLLAALVLPALASQAHPAAAQPAPVAPIRFLAPLPFEVRGDASLKPLALAAPELLASHLSRVGGIRIVERIQIDKMFNEWKFQLGNLVDEKSAVEVGRAKGADTLLLGSISPIPGGNELLIQARLVDASSGVVRMSGDVSTARSEVTNGLAWLAYRLSGAPSTPNASASAAQAPSGVMSPSKDAFDSFAIGLVHQYQGQQDQATALFYSAVSQDPTFTSARSAVEMASEALMGKSLYAEAVGKALKHNETVLLDLDRATAIWDSMQRLLRVAPASPPPSVELTQSSRVEPNRVVFSFGFTLRDRALQEELAQFLRAVGYRNNSRAPSWEVHFSERLSKGFIGPPPENEVRYWEVSVPNDQGDFYRELSEEARCAMRMVQHRLVLKVWAGPNPIRSWVEDASLFVPSTNEVLALGVDGVSANVTELSAEPGASGRMEIGRDKHEVELPLSLLKDTSRVTMEVSRVVTTRERCTISTPGEWKARLAAYWARNSLPLPGLGK